MKSTYLLIGIGFDHLPMPSKEPKFIKQKSLRDYKEERDIFDIEKYERQILISEIFSKKDLSCYKSIDNSLGFCDELIINIDYEPNKITLDARRFFALRVLQVMEFFHKKLPNVNISLMGSEQIKKDIEKTYKEKKLKTFCEET